MSLSSDIIEDESTSTAVITSSSLYTDTLKESFRDSLDIRDRIHVTAEDDLEDHQAASLKTIEFSDNDISNEGSEQSNAKTSRELKLLLALSKESNLETNILHKRHSIDLPKTSKIEPVTKPTIESEVTSKKTKQCDRHGKYPITAESELENVAIVKEDKPLVDKRSDVDKNIKRRKESLSDALVGGTGEEKKILKSVGKDIAMFKVNKDMFCWRCHRESVNITCETCPRSYHQRCLKQTIHDSEHWPCPECASILRAENTQTRSNAMKGMTLEHLCGLLKFAVKRMMECTGSKPFIHPVNCNDFPHYKKYIIQPMDLTLLEKNIKGNLYGSTQAFEADAKWILHNSIVFNSYQSKLTSVAKTIVKICKQEMSEIENCPTCYLNANTRKATWFVEVCPKPHILLWAKLKGFPFWPAKAMCTNAAGMVDVRFFGAHDRAWVPFRECFLYSRKDPNSNKQKRNDIIVCIKEVDLYINNLKVIYGEFNYAPFKIQYDPDLESKQMLLFLPKYKPNMQHKAQRQLESVNNSDLVEKKCEPSDEMAGYGTDDDSQGEQLVNEERRRYLLSNNDCIEKDKDVVEKIEPELDDDTQVANNTSSDKVPSGPVRIRGANTSGGNVTGKLKLIPKKVHEEETSKKRQSTEDFKENPRKLSRRNSDQSVKNESGRLSTTSDKINRLDISENMELSLRNYSDGSLNISENIPLETSEMHESQFVSDGTDVNKKPVQVDVNNAELSISPQSKAAKIADKLIKKLSDVEGSKGISSETIKTSTVDGPTCQTESILATYKSLEETESSRSTSCHQEENDSNSTSEEDISNDNEDLQIAPREFPTDVYKEANYIKSKLLIADILNKTSRKDFEPEKLLTKEMSFDIFENSIEKDGIVTNSTDKSIVRPESNVALPHIDNTDKSGKDGVKEVASVINTEIVLNECNILSSSCVQTPQEIVTSSTISNEDLIVQSTVTESSPPKTVSENLSKCHLKNENRITDNASYENNLKTKKPKMDLNVRLEEVPTSSDIEIASDSTSRNIERNIVEVTEPTSTFEKISPSAEQMDVNDSHNFQEKTPESSPVSKNVNVCHSNTLDTHVIEQVEYSDDQDMPLEEAQIDEINIRNIIHSSLNQASDEQKQGNTVDKPQVESEEERVTLPMVPTVNQTTPNASKKRKLNEIAEGDENNLKFVKIVPIQTILNKTITSETITNTIANSPILLNKLANAEHSPKESQNASCNTDPSLLDLVCVEIKSEPESDEEIDETEYMEKKRRYLSALNISEKQDDSLKVKKPEIKTRSKTEEKNKFRIVDNLTKVIDEVASHYSADHTRVVKSAERRKSCNLESVEIAPKTTEGKRMTTQEMVENKNADSKKSPNQEVGEIFVKSFAKIQTAKPRTRKSFPTPNFHKVLPPVNREAPKIGTENTSLTTLTKTTSTTTVTSSSSYLQLQTALKPIETINPPGLVIFKQTSGVNNIALLPSSQQLTYSPSNSYVTVIQNPGIISTTCTITPQVLNAVVAQSSQISQLPQTMVQGQIQAGLTKRAFLNLSRSQNYIPQNETNVIEEIANASNDTNNPVSVLTELLNDLPTLPSLVPLMPNTESTTNDNNNNAETRDEVRNEETEDEFSILNSILPDSVSRAMSDVLCRPLPKLKPRPPGPLSNVFDSGPPSTAGPVSARINSISHRLGDYFRGMLIELLQDLGKCNNSEATISSLKLELESLQHKHAVEIMEIRKNICTILKDIQKSIAEEKNRIVEETRTVCEVETIKRIEEAKSKQWCASCSKEAQFYCCWNTSYCDYPCQQRHWPKHMSKCTQNSGPPQPLTSVIRPQGQVLFRPSVQKNFGRIVAKPTKVYLNRAANPKAVSTFKSSVGNHLTLVDPASLEFLGTNSAGNKVIATTSILNKGKTGNITVTSPSSSQPVVLNQSVLTQAHTPTTAQPTASVQSLISDEEDSD